MTSNRPFAVFDIDGTLVRWQLYHAIGDELAKTNLIDPAAFIEVKQARLNWKKRTGEQSFVQYERALIKVFDKALVGLAVEDFMTAAETVFEQYKEQVYTYTRDLINELRAKKYLLFAISGSPDIIVKKMAEYYGFDDYAATTFPSQNGRFLGFKILAVHKKAELLNNLINKHSATITGSVAVGDSDSDISILSVAEKPIAFNPTKELYEHAVVSKWEIVLERKNVIYHLTAKEGGYFLDGSKS